MALRAINEALNSLCKARGDSEFQLKFAMEVIGRLLTTTDRLNFYRVSSRSCAKPRRAASIRRSFGGRSQSCSVASCLSHDLKPRRL